MENKQIKFYKDQIGKFSNISYFTEGLYTKIAKGRLISITAEGKLLVEGDYKSWIIDPNKIVDASFLKYEKPKA